MTGLTIVCVGGPLDGLEIERKTKPPLLVWVSQREHPLILPTGAVERGRLHRQPAPGRHYYQTAYKVRTLVRGGLILGRKIEMFYVGHKLWCARCELIHGQPDDGPPQETCTLCGTRLRTVESLTALQ